MVTLRACSGLRYTSLVYDDHTIWFNTTSQWELTFHCRLMLLLIEKPTIMWYVGFVSLFAGWILVKRKRGLKRLILLLLQQETLSSIDALFGVLWNFNASANSLIDERQDSWLGYLTRWDVELSKRLLNMIAWSGQPGRGALLLHSIVFSRLNHKRTRLNLGDFQRWTMYR